MAATMEACFVDEQTKASLGHLMTDTFTPEDMASKVTQSLGMVVKGYDR